MSPKDAVNHLRDRYGAADDLVRRIYTKVNTEGIDMWNAHVLAGLLASAAAAEKHLRRGYEAKDVSYVCWAARNLVELGIWCQFCREKENARRFYQDSLRDLNGTMMAYQELLEVINPSDEQRKLIGETRQDTTELSESLGVHGGDTRFLPVSEAAEQLGKGIWFRKTNKILSKLVHPTAYAVTTSITGSLFGRANEDFFMVGYYHALAVLETIEFSPSAL